MSKLAERLRERARVEAVRLACTPDDLDETKAADLLDDCEKALRKWLGHAEMNKPVYTTKKGEWVPLVVETRAALAKLEGGK